MIKTFLTESTDEEKIYVIKARDVEAWVPTDEAYTQELSAGWITIWIKNPKNGKEIYAERTNDGNFVTGDGEDLTKEVLIEELDFDEELAESCVESINDFDYNDIFLTLSEEGYFNELENEAIEEAKKESRNSLEDLIEEYIDEDSGVLVVEDEIIDEIYQEMEKNNIIEDFYASPESDGSYYADPIIYYDTDKDVIDCIKKVLFKHGILNKEDKQNFYDRGTYIDSDEIDQTDLFNESFNIIKEKYLKEELDKQQKDYLEEIFSERILKNYSDKIFLKNPKINREVKQEFKNFVKNCKLCSEEVSKLVGYKFEEEFDEPFYVTAYNVLYFRMSTGLSGRQLTEFYDLLNKYVISSFKKLDQYINKNIESFTNQEFHVDDDSLQDYQPQEYFTEVNSNYSFNYGMSNEALDFVFDLDIDYEREVAEENNRDTSRLNDLQINQKTLDANKKYGNKIHELLVRWTHENLDKFSDIDYILKKTRMSPHYYKTGDLKEDLVNIMMDLSNGAVFLYFMEYRGEGVGTWDGDWDCLFKDGRYTVKELGKYIKEETSEEGQALQTAIDNNIYEYVDEPEEDLDESVKNILSKYIKETNYKFKIGDKVKVVGGSGLDSDRVGTVVPMSQIPIDLTEDWLYQRRRNDSLLVKTDDGYFIMLKNRLVKV